MLSKHKQSRLLHARSLSCKACATRTDRNIVSRSLHSHAMYVTRLTDHLTESSLSPHFCPHRLPHLFHLSIINFMHFHINADCHIRGYEQKLQRRRFLKGRNMFKYVDAEHPKCWYSSARMLTRTKRFCIYDMMCM